MFTVLFDLLSATVVTGCSDKDENKQEIGRGHSHD